MGKSETYLWYMSAISGIGEVGFYAEKEEVESALIESESTLSVKSLTHMIINPNGLAMRQICDRAELNCALIAYIALMPKGLVDQALRVWDDKKSPILVPRSGAPVGNLHNFPQKR